MVSVRAGSACLMALLMTACGGSGGELPLLPPDSSLTYSSPPPLTVTVPIAPIVPTHNVYLTNFSIIPNLPAGLVLDPATGVISGTPTQVSGTTTYTVSVPDGNSAVTATLVITVNPLPSGVSHPRAASELPQRTYRLTASDAGGADTFDPDIEVTAPLGIDLPACNPTGPCTIDGVLAGPTLAIRQWTGWNTYSSVDGAPIAHLDIAPGFAAAWALAIDGSYLLFVGSDGMQVITPQGMTLFTRAGDYLSAAQRSTLFAGPNEVRVANGPAGAQVIENIAVPSGAATTTLAYAGNFAGWFGLAASDEWYWVSKNTTQVYLLRSAGVVAATYANGFSDPTAFDPNTGESAGQGPNRAQGR